MKEVSFVSRHKLKVYSDDICKAEWSSDGTSLSLYTHNSSLEDVGNYQIFWPRMLTLGAIMPGANRSSCSADSW